MLIFYSRITCILLIIFLATNFTSPAKAKGSSNKILLQLTYPAGKSPKVFTDGWVFGAKAILNPGTNGERDISGSVRWSGTATFSPDQGALSRPRFNAPGSNTITLKISVNGHMIERSFPIVAVSPTGYAGIGTIAYCPADAHGCNACPHHVSGPIISGSPNVTVAGRPAARVGDNGTHSACCGPNTFKIASGDPEVLINGKPAARIGDKTIHCGGVGKIGIDEGPTGSPDHDLQDHCPSDPEKTEPGICGCGVKDTDSDSDGIPDCKDNCPVDPDKTDPGVCGCGTVDTDSDHDGVPDCNDECPDDPNKTSPGPCGCGIGDTDSDGNGIPDCNKTKDSDGDGIADTIDNCPDDPAKADPGECGCGVSDDDADNNGVPDCNESQQSGCTSDSDCLQGYVCDAQSGQCVDPFDKNYDANNQLMASNAQDRQQATDAQNIADANLNPDDERFTSDDLADDIDKTQAIISAECNGSTPCPDGQVCENGRCVNDGSGEDHIHDEHTDDHNGNENDDETHHDHNDQHQSPSVDHDKPGDIKNATAKDFVGTYLNIGSKNGRRNRMIFNSNGSGSYDYTSIWWFLKKSVRFNGVYHDTGVLKKWSFNPATRQLTLVPSNGTPAKVFSVTGDSHRFMIDGCRFVKQ